MSEVDGSADWAEDTTIFSDVTTVLRGRGIVLEHHSDLRLLPNVENLVQVVLAEVGSRMFVVRILRNKKDDEKMD